jgi:hypothetical protein
MATPGADNHAADPNLESRVSLRNDSLRRSSSTFSTRASLRRNTMEGREMAVEVEQVEEYANLALHLFSMSLG